MATDILTEYGEWMLPGQPNTRYSGKRKPGYVAVDLSPVKFASNLLQKADEAVKQGIGTVAYNISHPVETISKVITASEENFKFRTEVLRKQRLGLPITDEEKQRYNEIIKGEMGTAIASSQPMKITKTLIGELVNATKTGKVVDLLKGAGTKETIAQKYASSIAKTNTETGIVKILGAIEKESAVAKIPIPKPTEIEIPSPSYPATRERGFITSVKEVLPELKIAGQYIPRSTDALSIKAANLIKDSIETAESIAMENTDDKAVAIASELIKEYGSRATNAMDEFIKNAYYEKAGAVAVNMASKLTELGRGVQAASILARLTPEGQLKFAARTIQKYNEGIEKSKGGIFGLKKKIPELTKEQSRKIFEEMKAIQLMNDGLAKAERFHKLQQYIGELIPSPLYRKLVNVWKAGLLTGLKTSGLNIFANVGHGRLEAIKEYPAEIIDSVASLFTGEHTISAFSKKSLIAELAGMKEGFMRGVRYLKTGFDERNLARKLDWNRVNFGKSKFAKGVQAYEQTIFKTMGAEDQPFYYGAKAKSIVSQAIAKAKNSKLKGKDASDFIDNLIENPTDEVLKYAVLDAETAVFQNATELGKAARTFQKLPGGEIILPFGPTPSAVAMQILNYTPLGAVKTLIQNTGKGRFDQRLFSQGMGRAITGTAILYIGSELMKKGLITLDRPTGEKEQKLWELEGRQANSIKLGGEWQQMAAFGPAGNVLLIGAHFQDELSKSGSPTEGMAKATAGSMKSFTEQTFLKGISSFADAVTDPARSAYGYVVSLVSSVIPTIIADLAKSIDPLERRTESIPQGLQARTPGLRQGLEPQVNVLGEEKKRGGNILETMIDPFRPTKEISTPLIDELRRLWDAGYKVSPTLLGDKKGYDSLTPSENTKLWKRAGEISKNKLDKLIVLPEYQQADDEQKADSIEKFVDEAKKVARVEVVIEKTKDLSNEKLKAQLAILKKSGLMTIEIYNLWLDLGGEEQMNKLIGNE